MSSFNYKAMDSDGRIRRGQMEASNEEELFARLDKMGLDLISFKPVRTGGFSFFPKKAITRRDLIDFCFQLEQLTTAGVSLLQGLADLRATASSRSLREMLSAIITSIQEGQNFSDSLRAHPKAFNEVFISLVKAGEESGQLPQVFNDLAENLKWEDELMAKAKKAITYPSVVAVVVMSVVTLLMVFLVPQLISFIESMEGELPMHTVALLAVSDFFVEQWHIALGVPIATVIAIKTATKRSQAARLFFDTNVLKVPLIGEILKKITLARFCKIFAMMYRSGVSVLQILETTERTSNNLAISLAISDARKQIAEGGGISQSFENTGIFPPLVIRMIAIGENTGELDKALMNVTYFFDRDVKELIGKLESAIEPALTVVLGGILGWIMLSVLGPIYDLMSKIK